MEFIYLLFSLFEGMDNFKYLVKGSGDLFH